MRGWPPSLTARLHILPPEQAVNGVLSIFLIPLNIIVIMLWRQTVQRHQEKEQYAAQVTRQAAKTPRERLFSKSPSEACEPSLHPVGGPRLVTLWYIFMSKEDKYGREELPDLRHLFLVHDVGS